MLNKRENEVMKAVYTLCRGKPSLPRISVGNYKPSPAER